MKTKLFTMNKILKQKYGFLVIQLVSLVLIFVLPLPRKSKVFASWQSQQTEATTFPADI